MTGQLLRWPRSFSNRVTVGYGFFVGCRILVRQWVIVRSRRFRRHLVVVIDPHLSLREVLTKQSQCKHRAPHSLDRVLLYGANRQIGFALLPDRYHYMI
jgi:hypothetical protein